MKTILKALSAAVLLTCSSASLAADKTTIGVVVKIGGIPWFNAMEQGMKESAEQLGIDAFMIAPTSADPALQVRAVEDLIARKVDVIGVVPNDAEVLEPVFKRAREQGIKIITHESVNSKNIDYDFEMITNKALGEANAKLFAEKTGCKGGYAVFVGGLSVPGHNAWADAAISYLKSACPDMKQVSERFGVSDDVEASRTTSLDLMRAHDNLVGIMSFGSQGTIGSARAAEERGIADKFISVGIFSPGQGARLVHKGHIQGGFIWSPLEAGKAFVELGKMVADGKDLTQEKVLPILGEIKINGKVVYAEKPLELSKETVDNLAELGL